MLIRLSFLLLLLLLFVVVVVLAVLAVLLADVLDCCWLLMGVGRTCFFLVQQQSVRCVNDNVNNIVIVVTTEVKMVRRSATGTYGTVRNAGYPRLSETFLPHHHRRGRSIARETNDRQTRLLDSQNL